MGVNMVGA